MPYESWLKATAPTYMQDQYGQAWLGGIGAAFDDYAQQYIAGTKAAFPDFAPLDALGIIGDEIGIDRGPFETDQQYAARLVGAWLAWKFAGTPLGLLVALYWAGFGGGILVQQNGQAYSLSGTPVAGADPTSNLAITPCSALATVMASSVTPPTFFQTGRSIPSGTPWWEFDTNTDFCSRFAVLYPGPLPSSFMTTGLATFNGTNTAPVVWSNVFPDTTYKIQVGIPDIPDGGGPVSVVADNTTKTTTGVTLLASGPFTGTVSVLAWQAGANPYADLHPADLQRLKSAIQKWKPAKAACVGVFAAAQGKFMGWPVQAQSVNTMGPNSIVNLTGSL